MAAENRRQLFYRMAAALIAVTSLTSFLRERAARVAGHERILLYTPALDLRTEVPVLPDEYVCALPHSSAPRGAVVIPDLEFALRHNPGLRELRVAGDGIQKMDTPFPPTVAISLANDRATPAEPRIVAIDFSPQINLGDALVVRGRVDGLRAPVQISLADPGGENSSITLDEANPSDGTFLLRGAATKAVGDFRWKLRVSAITPAGKIRAAEEIAVSVRAPHVPRILVLESSPHLDTARLRGWYAKIGGKLVSRTQVSRGRYRYAASDGQSYSFSEVEEKQLAVADIVVLDENARQMLTANERAVLETALRAGKVGLLIIGPPAKSVEAARSSGLFPEWDLSPVDPQGDGADRRVRLSSSNWLAPQEPISVENFEIKTNDAEVGLLRDAQGRLLAAVSRRGEGRVVRSLVRDTWQWERGDDAGSFARYWSWMFSYISPSRDFPNGSIGDLLPTPDWPTGISWNGVPAVSAPQIFSRESSIKDDAGHVTLLALRQDPYVTGNASGRFWPQQSGWHRASLPSLPEGEFNFWVYPTEAWTGVRAENAREFTRELAARNRGNTAKIPGTVSSGNFSRWMTWICGICALGYLWIEGRSSASSKQSASVEFRKPGVTALSPDHVG